MSLQLIFCVESNKKAKTDWYYIQPVITHYYETSVDIKLSPVYMGSKSRYNNKNTIKEIDDLTKRFSGESKVIYCIDTDDITTSSDAMTLNNKIKNFCEEKNFELVWFCRDTEEVMIGERVPDSEKVDRSIIFNRKKEFTKINTLNFEKDGKIIKTTNLFKVLNKYIHRQQF